MINVKFDKIGKGFGIAMVAIMVASLLAVGGVAADEDVGDITVTVGDDDEAVANDSVSLYDMDDEEVESVETDEEGEAVFEDVEYGDYYFVYEYEDDEGETVTVESSDFEHENEETFAVWDVDGNSLTIDTDEESYLESVVNEISDNIMTGTPENVDDTSGWGLIGVTIGTAIFFVVVGAGLILARIFGRIVLR